MILVFGTICIDRICRVPQLPASGGYVEITEQRDYLGGEAANTAAALRAWNADFSLYGNSLGVGPEADNLIHLLERHGLRYEQPSRRQQEEPPICTIYVTPDGDRTMFGRGFAAMEIGTDFRNVGDWRAQWLTTDGNMPSASLVAAKQAKSAGMSRYLMDFVDQDGELGPADYWQSSTDSVGVRNNIQKNMRWVQEWIAAKGCFTILSDGPNGFVAGSSEHPVRAYPPFPAPTVVDSTGAGDIFRAGMLYGLNEKWEIGRCLQFAACAGSLICGSIGATSEVPSLRSIEALRNANPHIAKEYR